MSTEQLIGTIKKVQFHDSDPTTDEPTDPWDRATAQFGSLGDRLKSTYRKVADEKGPSEDDVKDAFTTLLGAWNQVADTFADALNDPETRDHLKKVARSFAAAIGTTIADLGAELMSQEIPDIAEEE